MTGYAVLFTRSTFSRIIIINISPIFANPANSMYIVAINTVFLAWYACLDIRYINIESYITLPAVSVGSMTTKTVLFTSFTALRIVFIHIITEITFLAISI